MCYNITNQKQLIANIGDIKMNDDKRLPGDRGQGRKSLQGGGESPVLRVRVTPQQMEKVKKLGGPKWVRSAIDKARLVKSEDGK